MSDSSSERRSSKDRPPDPPEERPSTAEDYESTMKEALKLHIRTHLLIHDLLMRQAQWGFTATGRRRSKDLLTDLSERQQSPLSEQSLLEHEIAMQKSLYEFFGILKEIEEVSKVAKDYHEKGNRYQYSGVAFITAAAFGLVAAPLTLGLSLPLAAAAGATGAAAGAYLIKIAREYKDKIKTIAEKIEKSVKEFLETLQKLKNNLVNIETLSEELQESTVQHLAALILGKVEDVQKVLQQLSGLEKISRLLRGEGFVSSVRELYSQSEQVLTKLGELRTVVEVC